MPGQRIAGACPSSAMRSRPRQGLRRSALVSGSHAPTGRPKADSSSAASGSSAAIASRPLFYDCGRAMSDKNRGQPFSFGIDDWALAEAGGTTLDALHFDVDAICRAYDAIEPVARRLGVPAPKPRLAGFCYAPLAGLGARIVFPKGSEPFCHPLIKSPEEIDGLREPKDYLAAELTQQRLKLTRELKRRRPDATMHIGHSVEGPVTAAALIFGRQEFFTLPYEDPARAHRLMDFAVRSMAGYAHAVNEALGAPLKPGPRSIPDDFAGIFPPDKFAEFVAPYWDKMYTALQATDRSLHSELLRVEHLPFLTQAKITAFDPSADQFLSPAQLRDHCPCRFSLHIHSWHVRDLSSEQLQAMYRHLASYRPSSISFGMTHLSEEPKLHALLAVARAMRGAA
ncbi:MAG: hypothetical protein FJ272_15565 [Planctomycetes bacterium]|nr:hypothetical protein [Planctomycetota bacterium]